MVRIRLRRMGSKRQPTYRIVVADKESPRDGGTTHLHLQVADGELGRVIGRDGKLANAMRVLLRISNRRGRRVVLDIGD